MKTFSNFSLYEPEEKQEELKGVLYIKSDDDQDWYEAQKQFQTDTVKIMYNAKGVISCLETDASGLWPLDCSVAELARKNIPEGVVCDGTWVFNGSTIVKYQPNREEIVSSAEQVKARLMILANNAIAPLQDAVDLGVATDIERNSLNAWKLYRVTLSRTDSENAPDIEWPTVPNSEI
jgi:hypothetical protein